MSVEKLLLRLFKIVSLTLLRSHPSKSWFTGFGTALHVPWPSDVLKRIKILSGSDPQIFSESHFGFVDDLFQASETGEGKPVDGDRADFADRRFVQGRPAAFFMN
jgi:hypothetical protein